MLQLCQWAPELDGAALISHLGSQPVRTYIRAALEYLDLQYLYNQKQIPGTVALGEISLDESQFEGEEYTSEEFVNEGFTIEGLINDEFVNRESINEEFTNEV